jgi:hypothetical protein
MCRDLKDTGVEGMCRDLKVGILSGHFWKG